MAAGSTKRALQYHLLGLRTVASFPQADRAIPYLSGVSCRNFVPVVGKILEAAEVSKPQDRHPLFHQSSQTVRMYYTRMLSQLSVPSSNGKRAFLVDTLALVRRLEAQGLTEKQSEAITGVITEVLNGSLENVAQTFVSQSDMERKEMLQQTALSKLQSEMKSTQDIHFSTLQRETERLRTDIDKMRSELKYEIDKVTAGQRLDLNLERGRIRDELSKQNSETSNLTNKLDKEIHALKTQLEAAKYEVIKYCIGTIVSVTAVGLGLLRIMM